MEVNYCQFCLSNGESEVQYKKLTWPLPSQEDVRTAFTGKVKTTAPVLRMYRCSICQATGDQAHTQRYCPLNRDGKYNGQGASLTDLKKKKNAAGNFPGTTKKLTMYRHYQYLQYYREKMLKHTAEINRIQALREANHRSIQWAVQQQTRYTRSFNPHPSPPLSSSPDGSRRNSLDTGDCVISGIKRSNVTQEIEKMRITNPNGAFNKRMAMGLSDMLEELREGTEEVEMN